MGRFYEVRESKDNMDRADFEAGKQPRRGFLPTGGAAKKTAREWNDGKKLTKNCGVDVVLHEVKGGKRGMINWLNTLVGGTVPPLGEKKKSGGKNAPAKKGAGKAPKKGFVKKQKSEPVEEVAQVEATPEETSPLAAKPAKGAKTPPQKAVKAPVKKPVGKAAGKPKKASSDD